MKIKEGFILRKIADSDIVVPVGDNIANFNGVVMLNETATFLWDLLKEGTELRLLTEALSMEYQISWEVAQKDTERFISQLQEAQMLIACE